jgi:hypothetical protein
MWFDTAFRRSASIIYSIAETFDFTLQRSEFAEDSVIDLATRYHQKGII